MGREIRRVPPNWEHPKDRYGKDIPLHDQSFDEAVKEWKEGYKAWEAGTHEYFESGLEFWEWGGDPPESQSYRPAFAEEPTWWQVYETVSAGTPATPAFATSDELIYYLCTYGDYGYQHYGYGSIPSREAATAFVDAGSVTSMVVINNSGEPMRVMSNYEALEGE